jgi:hypothetical protein
MKTAEEQEQFVENVKLFADAFVGFWGTVVERVVGAVEARTQVERDKLMLETAREARQASADLEWRLLYEKRTMEFQNIAMRLGDLVEKQFHTVR